MFIGLDGKEVNIRAFSQASRAADVPEISFHGLRHTHATLMLAQGANPKLVSERLGHSAVAVTLSIYAHVMPGNDKSRRRASF